MHRDESQMARPPTEDASPVEETAAPQSRKRRSNGEQAKISKLLEKRARNKAEKIEARLARANEAVDTNASEHGAKRLRPNGFDANNFDDEALEQIGISTQAEGGPVSRAEEEIAQEEEQSLATQEQNVKAGVYGIGYDGVPWDINFEMEEPDLASRIDHALKR